jgi:hypothetical protein
MQSMVMRVPVLTSHATVLHVYVSVPLIPCLVDGVRYMLPEDVPPPESRDFRRMRQDKAPRAPTMRSLVKLALRCESATELGQRISQRYECQAKRAGVDTGRARQAEAGLDEQLDRLLGKPTG